MDTVSVLLSVLLLVYKENHVENPVGKIDRKNARIANLSGAYYVRGSEPRWPQGFDPKAAGVLVKERPKP